MALQLPLIKESVEYIQGKINGFSPETGVILGTGLSGLIDDIEVSFEIDYADIPHFPVSTVEFHKGKLVFGVLESKKVVVMQGRFHYYEGYNMQEVVFPVRVLRFLGISQMLISNAAGGINKSFGKADLMVITDHINLQPENPLVGINEEEIGMRWPDMFEAYDKRLLAKAQKLGREKKLNLKTGVYASVSGPNLETPAEYKYLEVIGADAVGMSTVPEVIACAHMGLPCFAVSVITDLCYPEALHPVKIEEIIDAAMQAQPKMVELFKGLV